MPHKATKRGTVTQKDTTDCLKSTSNKSPAVGKNKTFKIKSFIKQHKLAKQ